jgi:two-component system, NarL family, nitrate/nitrite response regulator NarL
MTDRIRIAIIDDHPVFRAGLAQSLRRAPDVEIAGIGGTADEAVCAAKGGGIDVLVLDLDIPGKGIEAIRRILVETPAAKILILTGSTDEEDASATLAIGALGYVLKGASGREIINAIRTVHKGQPYVTPELASRMLIRQSRAVLNPSPARKNAPLSRPALSVREQQVLDLATKGLNNREIAAQLGLSVATIKYYMGLVVRKWSVRNRVEAVVVHSRKRTDA